MPKVYSFDVDETLECSNGPITLQMLKELRDQGHVVGLCGNLAKFCTSVPNWYEYVSFLLNFDTWMLLKQGPCGSCFPKSVWLSLFSEVTFPNAEKYTHVGNIFGRVNKCGVKCCSHDNEAVIGTRWNFLLEDDFASGVR